MNLLIFLLFKYKCYLIQDLFQKTYLKILKHYILKLQIIKIHSD
jgi:hypothetical protein